MLTVSSVLLAITGTSVIGVGGSSPVGVSSAVGGSSGYFALRCVDKETGRGIPRVSLTTVDNTECETPRSYPAPPPTVTACWHGWA